MRYGGGNTHCEKKPEPENNFDPETGLYHYRQIGGFNWVPRCLGHKPKSTKQCGFVALKVRELKNASVMEVILGIKRTRL